MTPIVRCDRACTALYSPPSSPVRTAVRRLGIPNMIDPKTRALAVPIRYADQVDRVLLRAGVRVDVVLSLAVSR